MKHILALIASVASLAASPYGVSVPAGTKPDLPAGITAVRLAPAEKDFAATAKAKGIRTFGVLRHPDPLPEDGAWRDYVSAALDENITHWETLDSFNLGPRQKNTPFRYVEYLTIARKAAPGTKIGFSLADYDLEFLDDALREGAGGQFDFISLSPFPCWEGCTPVLAGVLPTLRKLLAGHGADSEMPVHITLSGSEAALAEAAPLALSLGFAEVFLEAGEATLAKIPVEPAAIPPAQDFSGKTEAKIILGKTNKSEGLHQLFPSDTPWDEELGSSRLHLSANPPVSRTSFLAAPGIFSQNEGEIEITVTAKRIPSEDGTGNPTGLHLSYESTFGTNSTAPAWAIPGDNEWQTHTWAIKDAKFSGKLGWNFWLDASGMGNDVLIREVKVNRKPSR